MAPRALGLKIAFVAMAGIAGFAAAFLPHRAAAPELTTGVYWSPSRPLPNFSLIDQRGQPFGNANLRGHWSLLFFGYTNCPDFCPTTLTTLAALQKRLRADAAAVRPQVIFFSVDARRDTPEQLAKYVPYFDPEFIGITGADQPAVDAAAAALGVAVLFTPQAGGGYSVDHSAQILVVNPAGRLAATLSGPYTAAALQADFARIVAARA